MIKITRQKAEIKNKHGIKLWAYPVAGKKVGVVYIEVKQGHFEEFYHKKCIFIYYIIEGRGNFYLNGKKTPVKKTDLLVIPPMTRIYYLGKLKMTLTTVPA